MNIEQPVCQCLLQPDWYWHWPVPVCETTNPQGLTYDEKSILDSLKTAWDTFIKAGDHTTDDINEFRDAIHKAQQLVALRVARRVDPDVWRQPE